MTVLGYELHPCARAIARGTSHSETCSGHPVTEGLACCLEEETGLPAPFYAVECQAEVLGDWLAGRCDPFAT
ncbi:hypothetical protein [Falsiruegeria litorea]|uniref:hypothetical protein n=1 Tax=Falsiruegeria litorea TaxID=1280831 RepID=UPI0010567A1A|nr:hypothetical protein [Falsiruegeria litorea]